jgi:hypothetical protein
MTDYGPNKETKMQTTQTTPAKLRGMIVDYYDVRGIGRIIDLNTGSYYFYHEHGFSTGVPRIGAFVKFVKSTIPPKPGKLPVAISIDVVEPAAKTDVGAQALAEPSTLITPVQQPIQNDGQPDVQKDTQEVK